MNCGGEVVHIVNVAGANFVDVSIFLRSLYCCGVYEAESFISYIC